MSSLSSITGAPRSPPSSMIMKSFPQPCALVNCILAQPVFCRYNSSVYREPSVSLSQFEMFSGVAHVALVIVPPKCVYNLSGGNPSSITKVVMFLRYKCTNCAISWRVKEPPGPEGGSPAEYAAAYLHVPSTLFTALHCIYARMYIYM